MSNDNARTDNRNTGDEQPDVGTDPMELPQEPGADGKKEMVAPDPQKVRQHEREEAEHERNETPAEHAERIKNA